MGQSEGSSLASSQTRLEPGVPTGLVDRHGARIFSGDRVALLSRSSIGSPFNEATDAIVIGLAHNGKRLLLALLNNVHVRTDCTPNNVTVIERR